MRATRSNRNTVYISNNQLIKIMQGMEIKARGFKNADDYDYVLLGVKKIANRNIKNADDYDKIANRNVRKV